MDAATLPHLYREHLERLSISYGAALEAANFDTLVIHAGTQRLHTSFDDQHHPLRVTPAFTHWIPLVEAHNTLVIRPGQRPRLIRVVTADYWEGRRDPGLDHAWSSFEVIEVGTPEDVAAELPPLTRAAFIGDSREVADAWRIGDDARNPPRLIRALDEVRRIKSPYERACLAEASRRGATGHQVLQDLFAAGGRSELSLHLRYLAETQQDDSETPYKNIVALDAHAAVLHHVLYDRAPPAPGAHSLLVDAGATCFGYASDITRTVVHGDDTFAALIAGIEHIQQEMCRRLRPGIAYEALHDGAHALLAPLLRELGIARGTDDELLGRGITRAFLPHGLGHSLGIQVHDVGCRVDPPRPENRYLRTTVDVEAGMVFTIEPGCYFIEPLLGPLRAGDAAALVDWTVVDRLQGFGGVRIEDNLFVTADGADNLTRSAWPAG